MEIYVCVLCHLQKQFLANKLIAFSCYPKKEISSNTEDCEERKLWKCEEFDTKEINEFYEKNEIRIQYARHLLISELYERKK